MAKGTSLISGEDDEPAKLLSSSELKGAPQPHSPRATCPESAGHHNKRYRGMACPDCTICQMSKLRSREGIH